MSNNFRQPGDILDLVAPTGGVTVGTPVQIGQLLVMPLNTAAQTLAFRGQVVGVFEIVKNAGETWTAGAIVYWDDDNKEFTTIADGNLQAGVAIAAAGSSAVVGYVRFDGVARAQEAT